MCICKENEQILDAEIAELRALLKIKTEHSAMWERKADNVSRERTKFRALLERVAEIFDANEPHGISVELENDINSALEGK